MAKNSIITGIRSELFAMRDEEYAKFHAKLVPTLDSETVIGVRTPALRAYAKQLSGKGDAEEFMSLLPHEYYEENNLHAFLIERIRNIDELFKAVDAFLPFVDNWATCDMMRPKLFAKHRDKLIAKIHEYLSSGHTYTVRYGIGMLMIHYLDSDYSEEYPELVANIASDEYYINMMRAWYFAEALIKQYDSVLPYIRDKKLDAWTHRKAIQKAIESYRITDEKKAYLRTLR